MTSARVLDAAQDSYHRRLFLPEGRHALAYLHGRGLTDATIRRFGLGWSGEGRGALAADLGRGGVTPDQLVDAGLMRRDDETGRVFDLFYNRVMFPIRDRRGRVISFGGRILGDGQPKYVNGPETALFSKRRTLYALDLAREAVRGGAPLVVVEGYMDVIALAQAGIGGAVAPLGTALTEEQLEQLWRLAPAPVLCFDGDAAGSRAAARAAELALPMLAPDRSLRLARLPAGEDPDTLVRRGASRFLGVLETAQSIGDALFDFARDAVGDATEEQRAALHKQLVALSAKIGDRSLSYEVRYSLLGRFRERYRLSFRGSQPRAIKTPRIKITPDETYAESARNSVAILLRHPHLVPDLEIAFEQLDLPDWLNRLKRAIIDWTHDLVGDVRGTLIADLAARGLSADIERALASTPLPLAPCAMESAQPAEAESGWYHYYGVMRRASLDQDVAVAFERFKDDQTEANHRVLKNLSIQRERHKRALFEEGVEG